MPAINPLPNVSLAMPQTVSAPARKPDAASTDAAKPGRDPSISTPAGTNAADRAALGAPARRTIGTQAPPRALSAEAPAGVDRELWSVLTTEERTHFAKLASMGPLTYGRSMSAFNVQSAPPPAVRGARLDVRV